MLAVADYFQGREKDVVIFSCVRTAGVHHRSIGFVADERRINVGITRARCALLIIGHAASLAVDERWRNLVKSAVERKVMFQPEKPYNDYMQQVKTAQCNATYTQLRCSRPVHIFCWWSSQRQPDVFAPFN